MTGLQLNVLSNLAGAGWIALLQIVFVPVYIALLGIEGYGLIGFHLTLLGALRILDMGLTPTMNREMARYSIGGDTREARDFARTLEVVYWFIAAVIGGVLYLAAPAIALRWLHAGELQGDVIIDAVRAMAVLVALQWPLSFYQGGLLGLQRQVLFNVVKAGMATLAGLASVAMLWGVRPSVTLYFSTQIVVAVLHVGVMAALLWRALPPSGASPTVRSTLLRRVHGFAAGMSGIAVLSLVLTQADKLILSKLLTLEQFGFYTLAGVLGSALSMVNAPVFNAFFPRFTALVAAGHERSVAPLFQVASAWIAVATVPAALVIALFSTEILQLWIGSAETARVAGPLVSALILGTALNGLMNLPYALQLAHASTIIPLSLNLVLVATYLPVLVVAAARFGALGAAWAWTAVNVVYVLVGVLVTARRLLGNSGRSWFIDVGTVFVTSLAVVLAWRLGLGGRVPSGGAAFAVLVGALVTATMAAAAVLPEVRRSALALWSSQFGRRT